MSNTRNTPSNNVSSNNIITRYDFIFSDIELQFDNNEMGIIIVVKRTKYIDIPSTPR